MRASAARVMKVGGVLIVAAALSIALWMLLVVLLLPSGVGPPN